MRDIIAEVIEREGGFNGKVANIDRGGYTKYGITQKTLSDWLGRQATVEDVKNLSVDVARDIYEKKYLTDPRIHTLPNPPQEIIFDISVNSGSRTAIRMLQKVINLAGFGPIDVDGILGPQTRNAAIKAQNTMGAYFQNAIVDERIKFYNAIVESDPTQKKFIKGWLNRANSFRLPV